jgi:hypothetical protein
MTTFHGTDEASAIALLVQQPLDLAKASALKVDGPAGFFLAMNYDDAAFFALRQRRGPPVVLRVELSARAVEGLAAIGCAPQPFHILPEALASQIARSASRPSTSRLSIFCARRERSPSN